MYKDKKKYCTKLAGIEINFIIAQTHLKLLNFFNATGPLLSSVNKLQLVNY